jgi:hypothetical protein
MIYAIFLCIYGQCSVAMTQDMFYPSAGTDREKCVRLAEDFSRGLGSKRGPDYEFRCASRESPWALVR